VPYPIVALVGYTNAGKSTLFNRLTGAEVMAKDMLFATLDPTMRRVDLPTGAEVILSDTVGFISDLPTELVAAFRATLEEVLAADVVVHVRDISHPESEAQARDVRNILASLGVAEETAQIELWNKLDLLDPEEAEAAELRAARDDQIFAVSALTGTGLEDFLAAVTHILGAETREENLHLAYEEGRKRAWLYERGLVLEETQTREENLHLAYEEGRKRAWLYERGLVLEETQTESGTTLHVKWTARDRARFEGM
jgi:GTP-binding protein HflX